MSFHWLYGQKGPCLQGRAQRGGEARTDSEVWEVGVETPLILAASVHAFIGQYVFGGVVVWKSDRVCVLIPW